MKTSKKLLSFFLAVVMIVTSCSVGFSAFAKDNSDSIWTTDNVSAQNAFDSLNSLADQSLPGVLMSIEAIQDLVFTQYAKNMGKDASQLTDKEKEQITQSLTLTDILGVLQPLLLGIVGKKDQSDFVTELMKDYGNGISYPQSHYDYLNARDDSISFYTLYLLCEAYKTGGSKASDVSKETNKTLDEWYGKLRPLADLYKELREEQEKLSEKVIQIASQLDTYKTASLYDLENFDFNIPEDEAGQLNSYYSSQEQTLKAYGVNVEIDGFAPLVYYTIGAGRFFKDAAIMYNLVKDGGGTVTFNSTVKVDSTNVTYDIDSDISIDNFVDVLSGPFLNAKGMTIEQYAASKNMNVPQAESYLQNILFTVYNDYVLMGDTGTSARSPFYQSMITGLAIKYSDKVNSSADLEALVKAQMPDGWGEKDCVLTKTEIENVASALLTYMLTPGQPVPPEITELFNTGSLAGSDWDFEDFTFRLPDAIVGSTAAKEYFSLLMGAASANPQLRERQGNMAIAFAGQDCFDNYFGYDYDRNADGYVVWENEEPVIGSKNGLSADGTIEQNSINGYFAEAENYIRSKIVADMFGTELIMDQRTLKTVFDVKRVAQSCIDKELAEVGVSQEVILTDEQKEVLNANYDLSGQVGTDILNSLLNNTILSVLNTVVLGNSVKDMIAGLATTPIKVDTALEDIWLRLMESPVATIVEILPVLVTLIDEVLEGFVLNGEGDQYNGTIYSVLSSGLLAGLTLDSGSFVGINQIGWDLNKLLPELLHWLLGDKDYNYTFYEAKKDVVLKNSDGVVNYSPLDVLSADFAHYTVKDADGNEIIKNVDGDVTTLTYMGKTFNTVEALNKEYPHAVFNCYFSYSGEVPYLTGIYLADSALAGAKISDIEGIGGELVTELATLLLTATEEFIATPELVGNTRYDNSNQRINSGLNNIFVALPQLFDIMENLAADKYGVDRNEWTYCYDGKIIEEDGTMKNASLEKFKSYGASESADRKYDIFDCFAQIFVGDWLNAIVSLFNGVISQNNTISQSLPIISGLLNSLGGFGEKSIITDILNGVFQIDRKSDYSFTFEKQPNGFTGWTKDNAYFLIANIDTLVEVIGNLVAIIKAPAATPPANTTPAVTDLSVTTYKKPKTAVKSAADSNKYTSNDLSNATDLIDNLDKLLSSLLSDATFNDFSLDKTDNILASIVTLLTNYLGNDFDKDAKSIVRLINAYTYYITGSESHKADKNNNVNAKKVYTNDSLTGLVVETYQLIEDLVEKYLARFNDNKVGGGNAQYNLIVEAIEGLISPDAVAVRLDGYDKVQKKLTDYNCWHNAAAQTSRGNYKIKLDWGIKAGDKEAFYEALSSSLRLVTSILGVLLIETGYYETVVSPIFNAICAPNSIKLEAYSTLKKDKEVTGYYDKTFIAILNPISSLMNTLLAKPATTLIKTLQGLASLLDDTSAPTIQGILSAVVEPIAKEINGLAGIFTLKSDKLLATSPTLANTLSSVANDIKNLPKSIKIGAQNKDKDGKVTQDFSLPLTGNNIIPIINTYLSGTGFTLKLFNFHKFSTAKTPAAAIVYLIDYVLDMLTDADSIKPLLNSLLGADVADTIIGLLKQNKITSKDILSLINRILEATDSPTLAYWTFVSYLQEKAYSFKYPAGITKAMADAAVTDLDSLVANIFPLLSSFGLNIGDDLSGVLRTNLFKNEFVTKLAVALYGALDNLDPTIKSVINGLGIPTSTKGVAKLLTDKSYGATYSSAAKTISAQSNWKNVKNVNWGFKDGSANAQQGFVNALVAVLRPLNDVLGVFLNEGTLQINDALYKVLCGITVPRTLTTSDLKIGDVTFKVRIAYAMKDGVFALSLREDPTSHGRSRSSTLKIDFKSLKNLSDLKIEGGNGYNSAIIPLLEVLQCGGIKTYAQYQKDAAKAKDNILLDILNPIVGSASNSLLNKIVAKPFSELTKLIPNIAMYLEGDNIIQLVTNLVSPVTDIANLTGEGSVVIATLIESLLGAPLQDLIIPLVNNILADKGINIKLADINWAKLADLGTMTTYKSKAVGENGRYLTGKIIANVDQGKVLITVLRYIATALVNNAAAIKNLICSIEAVAKNDLISSIIKSVFNTLATSTPDQIIAALFYILEAEPTNSFWNYTNYKTGNYTFAYPETVDVDFLKNLPPMLDGLIGGLLDLNGLINENLFKDELVSKLAVALYGAIEKVKINDNMNLTALLAQTDIDFSTANVSQLLTNEKYGKTYSSAASVIASAGSWKNVNAASLKWGVTDRESFFHALVAVLRPLYGVLDVLINDADLGLFNLVRIPGSNGYTSSIIPLLEAFGCYNIKTQYQYRQDIHKEYDAILLDIINPLWDKVEDLLNAPLQTLTSMIPNLALFIGNDGLCQIIDNLLTPISALADSLRPIVDLNSLLTTIFSALKFDLNALLAKIGVRNFNLDVYNLSKTLKPILGSESIIPLINNILGMINIKGTKLNIKLNAVDWLQLASHGQTIVAASQAPTFGARVYVEGDSSETLIAVLRYLIVTVNTGDNFNNISSLVGGLLGGADSKTSDMVGEILGMLQGDTDDVISELVNLLQSLA